MKKIILFVFLFMIGINVQSQIVNIPDPVFKNALVNHDVVDSNNDGIGDVDADTNNDGEIQVSEAEAVNALYVGYYSINSFEGIQSFINLEIFKGNNNLITDIDVSPLTNLKTLILSYCNLLTIDVSNNINLERLTISSNNLTELDVSLNTNLNWLYCAQNYLTSINVTNNQLLEDFVVAGQSISSIDLSQNPNLTFFNCQNNLLSEIDVSNNFNLEHLNIAVNPISEIDVSQNQNLQAFLCMITNLSILDISQNPQISHLYCYESQLTSLNIKNGNNLNLNYMEAYDNPNLICIQVDDVDDANNQPNWQKDDAASYSEDCQFSINDNSLDKEISLSPNPISNFLTINNKSNIQVETINIYDALGRSVLQENEQFNSIDVSNLASGLLFVQLETEQGTVIKKVIKE